MTSPFRTTVALPMLNTQIASANDLEDVPCRKRMAKMMRSQCRVNSADSNARLRVEALHQQHVSMVLSHQYVMIDVIQTSSGVHALHPRIRPLLACAKYFLDPLKRKAELELVSVMWRQLDRGSYRIAP